MIRFMLVKNSKRMQVITFLHTTLKWRVKILRDKSQRRTLCEILVISSDLSSFLCALQSNNLINNYYTLKRMLLRDAFEACLPVIPIDILVILGDCASLLTPCILLHKVYNWKYMQTFDNHCICVMIARWFFCKLARSSIIVFAASCGDWCDLCEDAGCCVKCARSGQKCDWQCDFCARYNQKMQIMSTPWCKLTPWIRGEVNTEHTLQVLIATLAKMPRKGCLFAQFLW